MIADAIGARFLRCARGPGWRGVCRPMGANATVGHVRFCFAKCQVLIFGLSHDAGSEEYRSQNGQAPNRSLVHGKSLWPRQNDFLRTCSQEIRIVLLSGSCCGASEGPELLLTGQLPCQVVRVCLRGVWGRDFLRRSPLFRSTSGSPFTFCGVAYGRIPRGRFSECERPA